MSCIGAAAGPAKQTSTVIQTNFMLRGRNGWMRRHGIVSVPRGAVYYIRLGTLTVPEARTENLWLLIARYGSCTLAELSAAAELHHSCARRVTDLLERDCYITRARQDFIIVSHPGPRWHDYVRRVA